MFYAYARLHIKQQIQMLSMELKPIVGYHYVN